MHVRENVTSAQVWKKKEAEAQPAQAAGSLTLRKSLEFDAVSKETL